MIIVSDTSPLRYLVLLKVEHVLPALFGRVIIPPAVHAELQRPKTPESVRLWACQLPAWLSIQAPAAVDPGLDLHRGEAEALSLTLELHADRVLMDDLKGRVVARKLNIRPVGTLAVIEIAAERGLIPLRDTLHQLRQTNFHITDRMIEDALARNATRDQ